MAEYWLHASFAAGKTELGDMLAKVKQQRLEAGLDHIPSPIPLQSKSAEAAECRGADYRKHRLFYAAILEYSKAYQIYSTTLVSRGGAMEVSALLQAHDDVARVLLLRLDLLLESGRYEDIVTDTHEILKRALTFPEPEKDPVGMIRSVSLSVFNPNICRLDESL